MCLKREKEREEEKLEARKLEERLEARKLGFIFSVWIFG